MKINDGKIPNAPWNKYYNEIDIDFYMPNTSFYKYFEEKTKRFGNLFSLDYYGTKFRYNELLKMIDNCAKGLYDYGVRKGDIVTICLPNTIESVVSFFAINKIGAIANFIHPLSSENEIRDSLNETNSKVLILFDINFIKLKNIEDDINAEKVILVSVYNYMPLIINLIHKFNENIKFNSREKELCILWNVFMAKSKKLNINNYIPAVEKNDVCVILHSGGTTGIPKGVLLSNANIMAYIESTIKLTPDLHCGDTILSVIPMFHGLGLVSNVLYSLSMGMFVVLRPRFDVNEYCKMIKKYKPQCLSGVPTLFDSVFSKLEDSSINLEHLKYVVSGGDVLNSTLKNKINKVLEDHGSNIKVIVGYGLTEAVSAAIIESCFITFKDNTVGIPFPGVYAGIFSEDNKEVPYGETGEICINGPTVMLGYYKNEEETKMALQLHDDGNIWLHTGDIGSMDNDGFVTYINRKKRIIVSSGYNIYPNQIEKIIASHPAIMSCAAIGIPHKRKVEVPIVYIVLKENYKKSEQLLYELKMLCMKNLPKYSWPYEYRVIKELPVTKLGKIDVNSLKKM